MIGQNTQKQIIAMVALMVLGIIGLGSYVWFDDGRRPEAEAEQAIGSAEIGARLFTNNCRVCHGNNGLGRDGNPSLIGPALNTPANTLAWRRANDPAVPASDQDTARGALQGLQLRYSDTIRCGRNGTPMPPWAIDQGGSLNFDKIGRLVALITTNAGNAWGEALERAREQDEIILAGLEGALDDALAAADQDRIDKAEEDFAKAEDRFEQGLPVQEPSVTARPPTCGQPDTSGSAAAAAPADDVDTSGFTANVERGQELYFASACNVCHGDTGEGGIGPKIAGTDLSFAQELEQYRNPRGTMPQFSADRVPDADVFDIYSWLLSLEE